MTSQVEEKIIEFHKMLKEKEYTIQQLEILKEEKKQDNEENEIIKYKRLIEPTEENMNMHRIIEKFDKMLMNLASHATQMKDDN